MQQLDACTRRDPLEECETLLWREVLARACSDAMYGLPLGLDEINQYTGTINRRVSVQQRIWAEEARQFIRMGNPDFRAVCAGASFDADYVHDRSWNALRKFDQVFMIVNPPPPRHNKLPQKCNNTLEKSVMIAKAAVVAVEQLSLFPLIVPTNVEETQQSISI